MGGYRWLTQLLRDFTGGTSWGVSTGPVQAQCVPEPSARTTGARSDFESTEFPPTGFASVPPAVLNRRGKLRPVTRGPKIQTADRWRFFKWRWRIVFERTSKQRVRAFQHLTLYDV